MEIYECNLCGAKSGDRDTMQKHIEQTNHKMYTAHQVGNNPDVQEPVQVKVTLDGRPWHKYECKECDFTCNWGYQMMLHRKETGHSDCKPLKPESDGQAEQPKSIADYFATLSPKELPKYYPAAAEDDEQEDRRRAKKKASQVTEVWWDEMTQTVRECKPNCKKEKVMEEKQKRLTVRVHLRNGNDAKTLTLNNANTDVYKVDFASLFGNNMCTFFGKDGEAIVFQGKDVVWMSFTLMEEGEIEW